MAEMMGFLDAVIEPCNKCNKSIIIKINMYIRIYQHCDAFALHYHYSVTACACKHWVYYKRGILVLDRDEPFFLPIFLSSNSLFLTYFAQFLLKIFSILLMINQN